MNTLLKLAWRDSRRHRGRLLLFISSIVLGVAALVAINSFSENLQSDIRQNARELLGADLTVSGLSTPPPPVFAAIDSLKRLSSAQNEGVAFVSMVLASKNGGTRLAQIRAIRGQYPLYGELKTQPSGGMALLRSENVAAKNILVDQNLTLQFDLHVGDSLKIGDFRYQIVGEILSIPGRAGAGAAIAPVVVILFEQLDSTLIARGSRVEHSFQFKFDDKNNSQQALGDLKSLKNKLEPDKYNAEGVEDRQRSLGDAFSQVAVFLNLVAFIALLLGCLGVASSVSIYIRSKLPTVAILRTIGASGQQAFMIFLIQIAGMGILGATLGAILGSAIQTILPIVFKDFLPVESVSTNLSWSSVGMGVILGGIVSLLFALLPLLRIRKISPLLVLRANLENETQAKKKIDWIRIGIFVLIGLFIFGFAFLQTKKIETSFTFIISVGIAVGALALAARLVVFLLKKWIAPTWSFVWRQGVASLFRPQNQTMTLMVSIGLGTLLISTLLLTQNLILQQLSFADANGQPNMIIFDIQKHQRDSVVSEVKALKMPVLQVVPIVTIGLEEIDGITRAKRLRDTISQVPKWVYEREYRVTYRDSLTDTEQMQEGTLPTPRQRMPDGSIGVTLGDRISKDMNAKVGSKLVFNIQGLRVNATVTGIRKINFNRVQTNFFVVFPSGFLEGVPQTNVVVTRVNSKSESAKLQQQIVTRFPSITIVDLTQILKTVDELLGKISFVIRFMAMFSILTGFIVLLSSIALSRFQRIRESVLLRTLGAVRQQIVRINVVEYFVLGIAASMVGVLLALLATWALAKWGFQVPFRVSWTSLLSVPFAITTLVVFLGWFNSRGIARKPPLEVLREEV